MKDRLAALKANRGDTSTDGDLSNGSVSVNMDANAFDQIGFASSPVVDPALNQFLSKCSALQDRISKMNRDTEELGIKHNAILYTPDLDAQQCERERNTADELASCIKKSAMQIRTDIKALEAQIRQEQAKERAKAETEKKREISLKRMSVFDRYRPSSANSDAGAGAAAANGIDVEAANQSAEMRIKVAQYSSVNRQFYDAYLLFNGEQRDYSDKCKDRLTKQIRIFDPEANDEQVSEMLERGSNVFSADLLAQTAEARRQLADIEARHTEIINLERSIRELHDLFIDIQMFVCEQGEVIDRIESNVDNAAVYVEKGTEQLVQASSYKAKVRKRKFCIIGIVLGIVLVVVLIIVLSIELKT